ncbi:MAG: cytochrome c3 family protein, partial [Rhodospirillales bacterium]|nr:cytochrome c3 family protein [Rhodospirillales bacterium]
MRTAPTRLRSEGRRRAWRPWLAVMCGCCLLAAAAALAADVPLASATQPAAAAGGNGADELDLGPDVVLLNRLEDRFEPVPFDHRGHARMAQMSDGCVTCHHHPPHPGEDSHRPVTTQADGQPLQAEAGDIPRCESCHPVQQEKVTLRLPNLKGAYHRQCLACHRDWAHANACTVCHQPKRRGEAPGGDADVDAMAASQPAPTPDDIVGRMHKPIPEPNDHIYVARFTPVAGPLVLFRHQEHVKSFGIKCASCHRRDSCADCHSPTAAAPAPATTQAVSPTTAPTIILTAVPAPARGPPPLRPARTRRD